MVIIEQNINQVKYSNQEERLTAENCYAKLINKNADIMILCEVTRPENIIKGISAITDKYLFEYNNKVLYFTDKNGNQGVQNKILIAYDKNQYRIEHKNENLYSTDSRLDFLHITLYDKDNNEINIIGVRIYPTNDFDDAKISYKSFSKLISYASVYDNVVIAGDFNNGPIMNEGKYNPKLRSIEYNYHKMHDRLLTSDNLKILTDGIDTWKYFVDKADYLNKWTSYNPDPSLRTMCDHFIVSSNFREESIIAIEDKDIETTEWGVPNHKIVELTGKLINSHLGKNIMATKEFRYNLCLFIEFFQYLENDLKNIYAKLIDGYYPDCFDEVAEKPIGALIKKLKEVEKNEGAKYLSDEDYNSLEEVRELRNYWCHTCYIETDSYMEQQSDMSIITKHRGLLERLKKEREVVRLLSIKMSDIGNKIPEKAGKWRLEDFCTITGVTFIPLVEG